MKSKEKTGNSGSKSKSKSKSEATIQRWYPIAMESSTYVQNLKAISPAVERLLKVKDYLFIYRRIGVEAQVDNIPVNFYKHSEGASERKRKRQQNEGPRPGPLDLLEAFNTSIAAGIFPHPHTLAFVASCFNAYLQMKGRISLDEAFGMLSVQKAGNPSKRKAEAEGRNRYCGEMYEYLERYPSKTRAQAAEAVRIDLDIGCPEVETMVRAYAAWLKDYRRNLGGGK
jgi:hypothetical protein